VFVDCLQSLVLTLQLMPAVCNVKKANFESKLGRLFIFVKVINLEFSFFKSNINFSFDTGK
jgi:hypothetical protein